MIPENTRRQRAGTVVTAAMPRTGQRGGGDGPPHLRSTMKLTASIGSVLDRKGHKVHSVAPDATVYAAIALMADKGVGALVVLDGGRLAGILSERDYARKVILRGRSSRDTRVDEIMTTPVVTVDPGTDVEECMGLMTVKRIRHLPVVEGDRLLGVVSIGDIVKWIVSEQAERIEHLEHYIAGQYPG
jgi:CBS domain-containing protein